jgi:RNA-directed DNA polymerase
MRQIRNRLSAEAVALRGANADAVIARLNPIVTGSPGASGLLRDVA